jgi:hypothetical protein
MVDFKKNARSVGKAVWGEGKGEVTPCVSAFINGAEYGAEEVLKEAMKLCHTGMTPGMIRLRLHNMLVEITGKGEKG